MNAPHDISFDPAKNEANIAKHGLSLTVVAEVIANRPRTLKDERFDYGETRYVTFGYVGNRLDVAVWTMRGDLVSVRKANKREVTLYG